MHLYNVVIFNKNFDLKFNCFANTTEFSLKYLSKINVTINSF